MPLNLGQLDYKSLAVTGAAVLACIISYRYYKDIAAGLLLTEGNYAQPEGLLGDEDDDIDIPVCSAVTTGSPCQHVADIRTCISALHIQLARSGVLQNLLWPTRPDLAYAWMYSIKLHLCKVLMSLSCLISPCRRNTRIPSLSRF